MFFNLIELSLWIRIIWLHVNILTVTEHLYGNLDEEFNLTNYPALTIARKRKKMDPILLWVLQRILRLYIISFPKLWRHQQTSVSELHTYTVAKVTPIPCENGVIAIFYINQRRKPVCLWGFCIVRLVWQVRKQLDKWKQHVKNKLLFYLFCFSVS